MINANALLQLAMLANLLILAGLSGYLTFKLRRHAVAKALLAGLVPVGTFELGSLLFARSQQSLPSAGLIVLALGMVPLAVTPLSLRLGRARQRLGPAWLAYCAVQALMLAVFVKLAIDGRVVEWVTGILDQPVILIAQAHRWWFLNVVIACGIALISLQNTLTHAGGAQLESLRCIVIAFLGLLVYFAYVSGQILVYSYLPQSLLVSGAVIVFLSLVLISYSLARYPLWEVTISVSRRVIFGSLTITATAIYLVVSGTVIDLLRAIQPGEYNLLFPGAVFAVTAVLLLAYLSPGVRARAASFVARNFFHNKYDYRELWMQFAEKSSGSLNLPDLLPKVAEFIGEAMFVKQVAIWLRAPASEFFSLAYSTQIGTAPAGANSLRLVEARDARQTNGVFSTASEAGDSRPPLVSIEPLERLGIRRFVLVHGKGEVLAVLGVGEDIAGNRPTREDDQLLLSIGKQLAHLILNQKLSDEILLAKEWESFNRFASFVIHDLKNLATLQGMTLENAKTLGNNPAFLADAFATFTQTTEKMINLIASLSVQRGQFSFKQQPVNVIEVIANTCQELKVDQRSGLKLVTTFPAAPPIVPGDRELLRKAFTNLLLNAIQSLPRGEGAVEVSVTQSNGTVRTAIKDTGCGIPPEQLKNLFRPFHTTKEHGMGIGLCHTRSIVEVHGGRIWVESQPNAGTRVEIELPAM